LFGQKLNDKLGGGIVLRGRGLGFLIILLIIGGLIGSLLGIALGNIWPILNQGLPLIGFEPVTIDLSVIVLTFGFTLKLNVASTIGLLLAFVIYLKL
jgi:hypothetical protein